MTTGHRTAPLIERVDRSRLMEIAAEWDDLVSSSPTGSPFMTWAWIGSWLMTLGEEADLEVATARHPVDGRLLGVAPFHVESGQRLGVPFRSLRLLGSGPAAPDHLDMPIIDGAGPEVAAALWETIERARRWDFVDLDGVAAGGNLARVVLRRRGDDDAESIPCPYLPLDGGWNQVEQRFGRSHRQNIGRYRRKLAREAGAPVGERMVVSPEDLEITMDRLEAMHQSVRLAHGDPGAFATVRLGEFHREVARRMLAAGRLRLWRLDVGDRTIAAIECMRFGDTVSFYTTGFDLEWAAYGPGRSVMARAIQGAAEEGVTEFDFLRGDEEYKRSWGTETRCDLRIRRPVGTRGRLLWAARSAASPLRSLRGVRRPPS